MTLGDAERHLFEASDPVGFVLFARNIDEPGQVRTLVAALRESVGREAPVLID
jgi:beta-N-acetylhexosaminidase